MLMLLLPWLLWLLLLLLLLLLPEGTSRTLDRTMLQTKLLSDPSTTSPSTSPAFSLT